MALEYNQYNGKFLRCASGLIVQVISGTKKIVPDWNTFLQLGGPPQIEVDCSVIDAIPEYYSTYYANLYAGIENATCEQLKQYKFAFEEEAKNLDKRHLPGGDLSNDGYYQQAYAAFSTYQSKVNAAYARLDCENQITQNQTQKTVDYIQQAGSTAKSSGSSNVGIYFVYGASALLILGGGFLLFRKMTR